MDLHFDWEDIQLGDMDVAEGLIGRPFEQFAISDARGIAELKAIYYLVMRQNDPDFTVEQLDKVTVRQVREIAAVMKRGVGANPTVAAAEA